jgi:hypothetical protein
MDVKHHALRDTPPSKKIINSNLNNWISCVLKGCISR